MNLPQFTFLFGASPPLVEKLLESNPQATEFSMHEVLEVCASDLLLGNKLKEFEEAVRSLDVSLGKIALFQYKSLEEDVQAIYSDCKSPFDVIAFEQEFGADSCLIIKVGEMPSYEVKGVPLIWVPSMEVDKQFALIERELKEPESGPVQEVD